MTIAITGATGFVGQALLDEAERGGLELRALTRREQKPRKGVEWVRGDLADTRALRKLARGAEAVIHVAGVVNAPNAAGFEEGNVTGTLTLVDHGRTGLVSAPEPVALAAVFDELALHRARARAMGLNARTLALELDLSWERVIEELTR